MEKSFTPSAIRKRAWRDKNPERYLRSNRNNTWKLLGIDVDKANELWYTIDYCQICGTNLKPFHIDHDHKTNEIRGLLCRACNHGLGNFKDNPKLLIKAANYLIDKAAQSIREETRQTTKEE
jgi:hypothetical protein